MENMLQKLAAALRGGSGMASGAANAMGNRSYQLYAAEAQANGQTPVSPQQFAAGQMQQVQAPAAAVPAQPAEPFRF